MIPKDMVIGTKHLMNNYGTLEILEYRGRREVAVLFESDYTTMSTSDNIRNGRVRDPYYPKYFSKGFLGEGPYTLREDRPAFDKWKNMLERCYGDRYPAYKDCSVSKDWLNFQNFAEWINGQSNAFTKGYELDKDIKVPGNKIYSADRCQIVTKEDNLAQRHGK
ncbi:HNH endonuclease [Vibrio phage D260]